MPSRILLLLLLYEIGLMRGLNVEGFFHAPNDRTRVDPVICRAVLRALTQGFFDSWIMWLLWPQLPVAMLAVPIGRTRHHRSHHHRHRRRRRHRRHFRGRCCCDFVAAAAAGAAAAAVADFWAAADDG